MAYDYFGDRPHNAFEEHLRRVDHQVRLRRHLRNTTDPFLISTPEFIGLYRMPQHLLMELVEIVRPYIPDRVSPGFVPLHIKVLTAVGFFAVGSYQRGIGRNSDINVSQSMVSNCIHQVTTALNHPDILLRFINFPQTVDEIQDTIARNERLGMPGVLGYVDGTLVKIVTPPIPEKQAYRSRKGFPAINTQIVCDADLNIMNVNARYPGSSNDLYIYRASGVRNVMRTIFQEQHCWLLGDSAYPFEPWLMLPLPDAPRPTPQYY